MKWIPQPSEKSASIEGFLMAVTGVDRRKSISTHTCAECLSGVTEDSFTDELSLTEYHISGMCQACQDKFFN